jgi:hypothetical protein
MLNDLEEHIRELKRENHEIILMADWNEDIRGRKISNFINKLELKETILSRHGTRHAPSTYIEGSTPIDGIFTTRGISIQGSGYLAFSEGIKGKPDHRAAWIDVTVQQRPRDNKVINATSHDKRHAISTGVQQSCASLCPKSPTGRKNHKAREHHPLPSYSSGEARGRNPNAIENGGNKSCGCSVHTPLSLQD